MCSLMQHRIIASRAEPVSLMPVSLVLAVHDPFDLQRALATDFAECTTVVIGAPTPPLFLNALATTLLEPICNDVVGSW